MLGSIQISGSYLSDAQVQDICSSVSDHKVPLLTLRKCKTKDNNFKMLTRAISNSKVLLQLNLNLGLVSSKQRIYSLADSLRVNRSITTLLLYGSKLGDKGTMVLCETLSQHPQVVALDIGNCDISDCAIPHIGKLLPNNGAKPGLHELTLSANKQISPTGWTQFAMAMAAGCHLQTLHLDYNRLSDHSVYCLAVGIAATRTLITLDLEATDITNKGAQMLLHLLENHQTNIRKLIIRKNAISRSLARDIHERLTENDPLHKEDEDTNSSSGDSNDSSDCHEDDLFELISKDQVRSDGPGNNPVTLKVNQDTEHQLQPQQDEGQTGTITDSSDSDTDSQTATSSGGSHLRVMDEYFDAQQTVYSNMYIQTQKSQDDNPPSYRSVMDNQDNTKYAYSMKASSSGYG